MPRLIKNGVIIDDRWTLVREPASLAALPPETPVIVPLALWKSDRAAVAVHGELGVWLRPDEDPGALAGDLASLPLIAVDFPKFTDGRGYSTAKLLRHKYRFTGELRAIGDVLRDQLYYMRQCGFDAFAVRADRSLEDALKGLADFSDGYQATVRQPIPLFRRRSAAALVTENTPAANDP
jgi:uncharacterized protein (DUF934 family)